MTDGKRLRVAIYARVSTDKQDNGNQLIQLREFAAQNNWQVVAEFCDVVSGSGKDNRPQFKLMMMAASQRKFDMLLFWKLDRLTREGTRKTLEILQQLDNWGVRFRSFMEPFLDSSNILHEAIISIIAVLAQQERIAISERTKAGLERARRAGKVLGNKLKPLPMDEILRRKDAGEPLRVLAKDYHVSLGTMCARVNHERERIKKEKEKGEKAT